jgi:hypothetical protein
MHHLTFSFCPDLTDPDPQRHGLPVGELWLDAHGTVQRFAWKRDRDLLNLDPITDHYFDAFPWLLREVLALEQPSDPAAYLTGLFSRSVLSVSRVELVPDVVASPGHAAPSCSLRPPGASRAGALVSWFGQA